MANAIVTASRMARKVRWLTLGAALTSLFAPWPTTNANADDLRFVEVASDAGVRFDHDNGMVGNLWLAEIVGAGVAVFDFDGDGWLDIWLVQGGPLASRASRASREGSPLPSDRLFKNAGAVGASAALRFVDITDASGVRATGYGMGIATGDIDNDGDLDVFLANFGRNQLFENLGAGRFRDITVSAGLGAAREWSVSASFVDVDGDGLLDLFVGNYLDFTLAGHKECRDLASRLGYCAPTAYLPVRDRLYRNAGDKRFEDITVAAGIAEAQAGGAMGVVATDVDDDGDTDIYVANDGVANHLWINQGGGNASRFIDEALLAGVALNGDGAAEASMGVDAEDYDGDCDVDLFLTHLRTETNTLYVNNGGWFTDASNRAGVAGASGPYTGFGTAWFDADNDGDLDLFSANGAVRAMAGQRDAGEDHPLRQRNQLWLNDGQGRYRESAGGTAFDLVEVSRGAAFGDLDNDGDMDIVVTNNGGPARLYRNESPTTPHRWLGLGVVAAAGKSATGAIAWLESRPCPRKRIATDGSYASANDVRLLFGLGDDSAPQHVYVSWPNRGEERFGPLAVNRYHVLNEGRGKPIVRR